MLLARQKLEGEHVLELMSIQLDRRGPVEAVQRHAVLEASLDVATFEGLVIAALDLVSQQQGQERDVVQLLSAGQRQPLGQCGQSGASLSRLSRRTRSGSMVVMPGSPVTRRRNDDRMHCRVARNGRWATAGRAVLLVEVAGLRVPGPAPGCARDDARLPSRTRAAGLAIAITHSANLPVTPAQKNTAPATTEIAWGIETCGGSQNIQARQTPPL